MKSKKSCVITMIIATLIFLTSTVGCGNNDNSKDSASSSDKKEITMWFWGAATDYQQAMKDNLYGWYNNSQDEYVLTIEFRNTVDTDIPVALAAKNGPDIIYASGPAYTSKYVEENLVLNLDQYAEQYGWKDSILGVMYDSLTVDGSLYSTPGGMCVGGLYYNKDLFEANGWEIPKTWDEIEPLFQQIQEKGIYPLGAGNKGWKPCNDHFSSMIINHGVDARLFYDVLTGAESFTSDKMVEGVSLTRDWYEKGYLSGQDYVNLDSQEVIQLLADERCAMVMAPTLYTQFVGQSFVGDDLDKVGFTYMPSKNTDEAVYDVSLNCNFSINADTEYADECAKILDYMLSPEFSIELTKQWPGYWATPIKELATYDTSELTGLAKMTIESVQEAIVQIDNGYFAFHPATFFPSATLTEFQNIDTVWQGVQTPEQFTETVGRELEAEIAAGAIAPLLQPNAK